MTNERIEAVAKAIEAAWKEHGDVPFPLYADEARKIAEAAIEAADRDRAPASFQCADGAAIKQLHRVRALKALSEHRCSTDLTDGFCGPTDGKCPGRQGRGTRSCIDQAEALLRALESHGISVVWDFDPFLSITMEKRS